MERIRPSQELRQKLRAARSSMVRGFGFDDLTKEKIPPSIVKYLRRKMPLLRRQLEEELAKETRYRPAIRKIQWKDSSRPNTKVYGADHNNGDNPQKRKVELKFEERKRGKALQNRPNREITDTAHYLIFQPPSLTLCCKAPELYESLRTKFGTLAVPMHGPVHLTPKQKNALILLIIKAERELNGAK